MSSTTTEHQAHVTALLGVVESGGKFYAPDARLYAWSQECPSLRDHVTDDRKKAIAWRAFLVERPYHPKARNKDSAGWRLCRFSGTNGAESDVGYIFATRELFADAMRLLRDFGTALERRRT